MSANPRRFTLRAAGREFTVLAKTMKSAWKEVNGWLRKEGIKLNPKQKAKTRVLRRRRNSTYGTSYFVSLAAAVRYYRDYGYDKRGVQRKIAEGEIHVGKPPLKSGDRLSVIDGGTRYQITEGERNRGRRRNRSVSMLSPRTSSRKRKAVESRTSSALARYMRSRRRY